MIGIIFLMMLTFSVLCKNVNYGDADVTRLQAVFIVSFRRFAKTIITS